MLRNLSLRNLSAGFLLLRNLSEGFLVTKKPTLGTKKPALALNMNVFTQQQPILVEKDVRVHVRQIHGDISLIQKTADVCLLQGCRAL